MSFVFKNNSKDSLSVLIEPSTDEFLLKVGNVLLIKPKFDEINNLSDFEFHLEDKELTIWLPHGQSADIYINGIEHDSY